VLCALCAVEYWYSFTSISWDSSGSWEQNSDSDPDPDNPHNFFQIVYEAQMPLAQMPLIGHAHEDIYGLDIFGVHPGMNHQMNAHQGVNYEAQMNALHQMYALHQMNFEGPISDDDLPDLVFAV
jgi:hypothetical protein